MLHRQTANARLAGIAADDGTDCHKRTWFSTNRDVPLVPKADIIRCSRFFAYYRFSIIDGQVDMYHAIVRRRVAALFAAVSDGDSRPVLEGLAPRFEHFFLGDHALGGSRFTLEKTRLWYERLYRLLPDISFDLRAIRISGPPWNTLVAVDWLESNSGTDGVRTFTPGAHVVRLAWGRMTYIGIYPDTVGVVATLQRLSRAGVVEATAEKIQG